MNERRYLVIANELADELAELAPGTRIPSEHALMARYGVSRAAARAAVQELERRLLVRRVKGSGTYVSRRIDYVISQDRRPSWHGTVSAAGATPRSVVIDTGLDPLSPEHAELLGVAPGTKAHRMRRLMYIDDIVASVGEEWVAHDVVENLADGMRIEESLDEVLRQMGRVSAVRSWCRMAADIPPPDVQEALQMVAVVPVWVVESVNRDAGTGRPLMLSKAWMRGDAVRVVMEMGNK